MTIMEPQEFEICFFKLNHRQSMYGDYCNYLFGYAQTHSPSKDKDNWVEFEEEEDPERLGKMFRSIRVSDNLEKLIERFYADYRIAKKTLKLQKEKPLKDK